jgi:hypothetical protein
MRVFFTSFLFGLVAEKLEATARRVELVSMVLVLVVAECQLPNLHPNQEHSRFFE